MIRRYVQFWRRDPMAAAIFTLLMLWAVCVGGSKPPTPPPPPPTNPPPPQVRGVIQLWHEDATGRLWPLGAPIREVRP